MRNRFFAVITALIFFSSVQAELFGQQVLSRTLQLSEALASGAVTLNARGNGSSSGSTVDGSLRNNTANEIRINVTQNGGLYLHNSGSGQNMIATQIFLSTGEYYITGSDRFIELSPNTSIQISLTAYCADFERDNPSSTETFSSGLLPSSLQSITSKIIRYETDHFDDDLTIPIQLALWRTQGESREAIAEKFDFTGSEWNTSTVIMNY